MESIPAVILQVKYILKPAKEGKKKKGKMLQQCVQNEYNTAWIQNKQVIL